MGTVYPSVYGYTVPISKETTTMTMLETNRPAPIAEPARSDGWQRTTLLVGGVAFAVGNLLHPLEHSDAAYESATWEAAHLLIFFSIPMLVLGLPVLHRRLRERVAPRIATIAVASSVVGLIGIAPGTVIEAFVAPTIGHEAMADLEAGGMMAVNALLGTAFLGGTLALGWAVRKAQLEPRWTGPVLVASAVVMLAVMGATGPVAGVVIITATVAYGASLAALARASR
jgi:hypothetical protein